jgi:hypothetical protein
MATGGERITVIGEVHHSIYHVKMLKIHIFYSISFEKLNPIVERLHLKNYKG